MSQDQLKVVYFFLPLCVDVKEQACALKARLCQLVLWVFGLVAHLIAEGLFLTDGLQTEKLNCALPFQVLRLEHLSVTRDAA